MPLIPPDAGVRLKSSGEIQPVARPAALPGHLPDLLPDLLPGDRFKALIEATLPDGSHRALIAGKSVTLALAGSSLPDEAKTGDMLELVVVDKTARHILARYAEPAAAAGVYEYRNISRAAQLVASLLAPEGETPQPAALARGAALLDAPPHSAHELANALAAGVAKSGLFYEAHQAQWLAGKLALDEILHEPQAQHARGDRAADAMASVPDALRPLVQQQLDAAATQRLLFHGEVWPGQNMEWQIVHEREERAANTDAYERWTTRLHLATPRLGEVHAALRLSQAGIAITLATAYDDVAEELRRAAPALAKSLSQAGIALIGLKVGHESA